MAKQMKFELLLAKIGLVISLLALWLAIGAKFAHAYSSTEARAELYKAAQVVRQKEAALSARRALDNRVQREADRLGISGSDPRLHVIRDIIVLFGDERASVAVSVGFAESGLRCNAINYNANNTTDFGPFQLNSIHAWRGNIKDCHENIVIAEKIQREQGWRPWVVYWKGIYARYL